MKKIYEAPKMLVEVVCVDEMLAGSTFSINSGDNAEKVSDEVDILGKDRDNSDWGGLW